MSEKDKQISRSPDPRELALEDYANLKTEALLKLGVPKAVLDSISVENAFDDEKNHDDPVLCLKYVKDGKIADQQVFKGEYQFERACGQIAANFRKEGGEWREGVSNLEYYKHVKNLTLVKHGFPESQLSKVVCAVTFLAGELADNSEGSVALNYFFDSRQPPIYMPFKSEEEFEEACRQCAKSAETLKKLRLADINMIIDELEGKTERVWNHKPQELPGTWEHNGKKYMTRGIQETLSQDEILLLCAYIKRRLIENDGGIDYLQVMESDDETVFIIDQLNREMKASGEFREEDNYSTMMRKDEY